MATTTDQATLTITTETNVTVYAGRLARLHKQVEVLKARETAMKANLLEWMQENDAQETISTRWGKVIFSRGQRKYTFTGKEVANKVIALKAAQERAKLSPNLHTLVEGDSFLKVAN
jgi:hypothetical protein